MAKRPTIQDLAEAAGVSVATVDRVLNGRLKVREETARKVSEAARKIGYHAVNLIEQRLRADLPELRMGFVLQKQQHAFYQNLHTELEHAAEQLARTRGRAIVHFAKTQSPSETAQIMLKMRGRVDAVAAVAVNHTRITQAVLSLQEAGVPTYSMFNDFAQGERRGYVGLNNLKAGRIAGWMMGTARPGQGKVAVFMGGARWHGHELRETGFRSYLRTERPDLSVLETVINMETRKITYGATCKLLAEHKDLSGIYMAGGGMEGAIQAVRERRNPGDVAMVVHELTPESRAALSDGFATMAIGTPLRAVCTELMAMMRSEVMDDAGSTPSQLFLEPTLYVPESV